MARLILVFGTQGAGKTTVLSGISSAKVVNVGNEMLKIFSKAFGITNRDQIREKALTNYAYMVKVRNYILKKAGAMPGNVIVDTHATVKKGDAYELGLSFKDLDALKGKTAAIVYIDASDKDVFARRDKDSGSRKRERDTPAELQRHRNINLVLTSFFSLYLEVPIYIIENADGSLKESQKRVEEIIKEVK